MIYVNLYEIIILVSHKLNYKIHIISFYFNLLSRSDHPNYIKIILLSIFSYSKMKVFLECCQNINCLVIC